MASNARDGSGNKLRKYPLDGGAPSTICDCNSWSYGASWSLDDTIVFACEQTGGLWRVSASGGEPEQITELDLEVGEVSHRLPFVLPDGKAVLFTVPRHHTALVDWSEVEIAVHSFETGKRKVLIEGGSDARYTPSGHLVFARDGTLWAAPFDLDGLALKGPAVRVLEGVSHSLYRRNGPEETGATQFAFSQSGSLAYIRGSVYPEAKREVIQVGRDGEVETIGIEPARYSGAHYSPDETQVLLGTYHRSPQIWTYDLDRGTRNIQISEGMNNFPTWSPDGTRVVFVSEKDGRRNLVWKPVDSDADAERLTSGIAGSWSPDGTELAFARVKPDTEYDSDIWILSMDGSRSEKPFLQTEFKEGFPEFSPDGRWMAYVSNESGQHAVYIQPYPGPGSKQRISTDEGWAPVWSGSGDELFYLTGYGRPGPKQYWSVDITVTEDDLTPGIPDLLFEQECVGGNPNRAYDVTSDGQHFLMVSKNPAQGRAVLREYLGDKVTIVLNWFEELKRLAPAD